MSKIEKKQSSKIKKSTIREMLWKQVNKKITKVKYTFNPTLYEHSFFYEDPSIKKMKNVLNAPPYEDDDENLQWDSVMSKIDWSELESNKCLDIDEDDNYNI